MRLRVYRPPSHDGPSDSRPKDEVVEIDRHLADEYVRHLPPGATVVAEEALFDQPLDPEPWQTRIRRPSPYPSRPQGLDQLHRRGLTGAGVTIAVVDSGIYPHADFGDRILEFKDFTSSRRRLYDPDGHGTHVAGIAAGGGHQYEGVAPDADLVAARIMTPAQAIDAIDWVIAEKERLSIDVLNLSLGIDSEVPLERDAFAQATQRAIDAGLVVVVAAGNEGEDCGLDFCPGSISTPGVLPQAITVGALDDAGTPQTWDDRIHPGSSSGPTRFGRVPKPDLVAPGVGILAPRAPGGSRVRGKPGLGDYVALAGTSQAAPMVAGAAALLLQANPELSHHQIKEILTESADPLPGVSNYRQGSGVLDLPEALEKAHGRSD